MAGSDLPEPGPCAAIAMLLYIHVPYCRARCSYCAFHSRALGNSPLPGSCVDTLVRELEQWKAWLWKAWLCGKTQSLAAHARGPDARAPEAPGDNAPCLAPLESVFFGGGTPSLLEPAQVARILEAADRLFGLEKEAEITLEANPESLQDRERTRDFRQAGVTRLSMGVQSLDDGRLKFLSRVHDAAMAMKAAEHVHAAGFASFGLDLMWGLPGQNRQDWLEELDKALALGPDHVSAYALTIEEGTPLARKAEENPLLLPPDGEQAAMFLEGRAHLAARGLEQYEISNYARTGHRCRHNLGYWTGAPYLGAGPSAVGTIGNLRVTRPADHGLWERLAGEADLSAWLHDVEELDQTALMEERVFLSLRTVEGLDLSAFQRDFGRDFMAENGALCDELVTRGMARITDNKNAPSLVLAPEGLLVANDIAARILARMAAQDT